ncbi:MAG TPA: hypothetical protein VNX28_13215 [Gemmataceae bacterium]|jgi:hypothetical protein|nr:hypothetical protein [Gemmataceae bacterium]
MPQCPQCNKPLRELVRRCPSCQADLDLLVDYVSHLRGGLERAQDLTKAGELGQAVWAYLEVLEVDPDNSAAKKQVAQVATAVRQFDSAAPGRRWLTQGRNGTPGQAQPPLANWLTFLGLAGIILAAFTIGYILGSAANYPETDEKPGDQPAPLKKNDSLLG